jgi:hypothetical protein
MIWRFALHWLAPEHPAEWPICSLLWLHCSHSQSAEQKQENIHRDSECGKAEAGAQAISEG